MAIDTPARLAILGAGPMGLEAALYARFLGYEVVIYERGEVAVNVRRVADEPMETPFGKNSTTLGIAAIQAQDEAYVAPKRDDVLTHQGWLDRYLLPLAVTDLIADHIRLHTEVTSISREEVQVENEEVGWSFRVMSRDAAGAQQAETFDGVLDCTGADGANDWPTSEPNYYVLGAKTSFPGTQFLMTDGHNQIRCAFTIIGDREALDLYASAARLIL